MNISFVIPNYNGEHILQENADAILASIKSYTKHAKNSCDVTYIDDASKDESISILEKIVQLFEKNDIICSLIKNTQNLGFSQTVNKAVETVRGDIIILLNTDVLPEKDFLEPLVQHFSDDTVFAVGCMDKSIENGTTVLRGRGVGSFQKGFLVHAAGSLDKETTLWVSGGSGAFRKSMWDRLGGFLTLYNPYYWEDIDLSYRALKSGYNVLFEKESIVTHRHEEGSIQKTQKKEQITTIAYRNQFYFVWLDVTEGRKLFQHVFWLPYHFLSALVRKDAAFIKGFISAVIHLPRVLWYRKQVQALFIKSDSAVLSSVRL